MRHPGGWASALESPVGSIAVEGSWDPRGDRFATAAGTQLTVWDTSAGDTTSQHRELGGAALTAIDFSTDGSRLATLDESGGLGLIDPATLDQLGSPVHVDGVPCSVSLGPDNRTAFVVTGPPKSAWPFWNVGCSDWALVDTESGSVLNHGTADPDGGVGRVDFSPRGDRVLVDTSQGLLVIDLETGRPVGRPIAHGTRLFSLVYSPDGGQILTSGTDGSATLWDAETRGLVAKVVTPPLFSASQFLPDGSVLLADAYEGAVYRWDTRPEYAVEFACRLAGRDLTEAEWAEQFGDRPFQETCPS